MFHSMRRLGLATAGVAAGLTLLAGASQAAVITVNSNAFTHVARTTGGTTINTFYQGLGGAPDPFLGQPVPHESMDTWFNTSGAPYYISRIVYDSNTSAGGTSFVANVPGGAFSPQPFVLGANASPVAYSATVSGGGKVIDESFVEGDISENGQNAVHTYVQINQGATELSGTPTATPSANDLLPFNGTKITVYLALKAGQQAGAITLLGPGGIDATNADGVTLFHLDEFFAVQTSGQGDLGDLGFHNSANAGSSALFTPNTVPEPGTFALFIGIGISGSSLLLRRRRR